MLVLAVSLAAVGCEALGGGSPDAETVVAPVSSPTSVTAGPRGVEATREAAALEAKRQADAASLASSEVKGGAALAGSVEGVRQATARETLGNTLSGEGRVGPGAGSGSWSAWWYRPGHGDFTAADVYAGHVNGDLFPVKAECVGDAVHPWRVDNAYLYYGLYESVSELRRDWGMTWDEFQAVSQDRLAWELLPEAGLRVRMWVDFAVMEPEGEAFYVVGATAAGRRMKVEAASGREVECPHWSGLERSSVILVRLD